MVFLQVPVKCHSEDEGDSQHAEPTPTQQGSYQPLWALQLVPEIRPRVSGAVRIISLEALQHTSLWCCHILKKTVAFYITSVVFLCREDVAISAPLPLTDDTQRVSLSLN